MISTLDLQLSASGEKTEHRPIGFLVTACGHVLTITDVAGAQSTNEQCQTCSGLWYFGGRHG